SSLKCGFVVVRHRPIVASATFISFTLTGPPSPSSCVFFTPTAHVAIPAPAMNPERKKECRHETVGSGPSSGGNRCCRCLFQLASFRILLEAHNLRSCTTGRQLWRPRLCQRQLRLLPAADGGVVFDDVHHAEHARVPASVFLECPAQSRASPA